MTDSIIERAARALSEAGCAANWDNAIQGARAAIQAIREPSNDMIRAMHAATERKFDLAAAYTAIWQAGIDVALRETDQ